MPTWKVEYRGYVARSGIQVSKKQDVHSPLIPKDSVLWGSPVNERYRARHGSNFE